MPEPADCPLGPDLRGADIRNFDAEFGKDRFRFGCRQLPGLLAQPATAVPPATTVARKREWRRARK